MNFFNSFDISGYGLSAQRIRANLISANIANANTTRTDEGGPYRRQMLSFRAFDFNKALNQKLEKNSNGIEYEDPLNEGDLGKTPKPAIMGVYIDKIVRDDRAPIMKYEPNHPMQILKGYVAYPNINPVVEMADLIEATRAYQANVAAFQSAKTMAGNAILMMQA